jgi:hypothetical protein
MCIVCDWTFGARMRNAIYVLCGGGSRATAVVGLNSRERVVVNNAYNEEEYSEAPCTSKKKWFIRGVYAVTVVCVDPHISSLPNTTIPAARHPP